MTLSVVMITRNSGEIIEGALKSIEGLWDELLVGDAGSTDDTIEIVVKYGGTIIPQSGNNLGMRKHELVKRAKSGWILVLDADERLSNELMKGIRSILVSKSIHGMHGYKISYQNYVLGRPVYAGGEKYAKVRLFRNGYGMIDEVPLHEEIIIKQGHVGELDGVIHHHSYRSLSQLFTKFTGYAGTAAQVKYTVGERSSLSKLFLYGPHMFWFRFVEDRGFSDGWRGLLLAFAFSYMEALTYWILLFQRFIHHS